MRADIAIVIGLALWLGGVVWWMFAGSRPPAVSIQSRPAEPEADGGDNTPLAEKSSPRDQGARDQFLRELRSTDLLNRPLPHWSGALAPVSVLLVEDDDDSRQMLADTLEYHGARVVAVGSAAEALRMLEMHHADVLVSDLRLPEKDGFALIRELRMRADPTIALIPAASITASRRAEDRHHALAAGFQIHMEKPVDPDDLVSAVLALATMPRDDRGITH